MIKRKTIIIDRVLQFRYAGIIIASMLVVIGLIVIGTMWYVRLNSDMLRTIPGSTDVIYGLVKYLVVIMVCYVVLVSVYSIFVSHKFAGPVYRFKRVLEELANGDLTARAFLREKDELNDLRESLNKAIKSVHHHVRQDMSKTQDVIRLVQTIRGNLSQDTVKDNIEKLKEVEKKLHEIGIQFKI